MLLYRLDGLCVFEFIVFVFWVLLLGDFMLMI